MRLKSVLIICASLIFYHTTAYGAEWKYYGGTTDTTCYYDSESISHPSKGIVIVWNKWVANDKIGVSIRIKERIQINQSTKGYDNFKQSLMQVEIKCPTKELCVLSVADYDNKDMVLDSYKYKKCEWGSIMPDTIIENLYKAVCPH